MRRERSECGPYAERFNPGWTVDIGGGGLYSRYVELDNYTNSGVACDPFFEFCQSYNQAVPVLTRTEARYETAFTNSTNTAYVPIRFGIEF